MASFRKKKSVHHRIRSKYRINVRRKTNRQNTVELQERIFHLWQTLNFLIVTQRFAETIFKEFF